MYHTDTHSSVLLLFQEFFHNFLVVTCRVNDDGFAPLDVAVMLGVLPIIKMLLLYGAQESSKCKCIVFMAICLVLSTLYEA